MTRALIASIVASTILLSGCADPYAGSGRAPADVPGEVRGTVPAPRRDAPVRLRPTPDAVVRRAADLTTNWRSDTVAGRYAQLARISEGRARRDALDAAARLPTDPQLQSSRTRSTGHVVGVLRRGRDRFVVVTHETMVADGLTTRRWRVTLATVRRKAGGYALAAWEPQP
jgi:hypothetical protein